MAYDLNDLQSDVGHLTHLLETIHDVLSGECEFVAPDGLAGGRLRGMDRVAALLWIARDMANDLDKRVEDNFAEIGRTTAARHKIAA